MRSQYDLNSMTKKFYTSIFALCVTLALTPALYSIEVEVAGTKKIAVQISPFQGAEAALIQKIVTEDLRRTLMIDPVSSLGSYSVVGSISGGALIGKLADSTKGSEVFSRNYSGEMRKMAHEFADDILESLTQVKGFSTSRIAFISGTQGAKELYTMDIDGANIKRLTNDKSISANPAWSNDGSSIAYMSYRSGYPDVYIIKLAQGIRTRVAGFPGINSGPAFSPNGQQLALTLSKDGNPEIYTISTAGGTPARLTRTRGTETSPSWSPDGGQIVYNSDERGTTQLFTISSSGGEPARITTPGTYSAEPSWAPNGTKIAYSARTGGGFCIWVYDTNTRLAQQVSPGLGEDPCWTCNSRHLVYSKDGSLYLLDTVTKQSTRLDNGLTNCTEPAISR